MGFQLRHIERERRKLRQMGDYASGDEGGILDGRTFLDLGFLHLVVDRLLEVSFVTVGKSVDIELRLSLIHGY